MSFLTTYLDDRRALGYERLVVGLSGGVDSVVCAQLAASAGPVTGVIIDMGDDEDDSVDFATSVAESIGIPFVILVGRATYAAHRDVTNEQHLISRIHVRSRLLTSMIFQFADNNDGLVIDTTDRSEQILRLYEEGQRGNVAPVIDLYKSELFVMADQMGFGAVRDRASGCPDLDNFDAFGLSWDHLDAILHELTTLDVTRVDAALADQLGVDLEWLQNLRQRVASQPLRTDVVKFAIADGEET